MKLGKTLVIAMAIILTMMVGYALFSESININGTATAKGEFNFSVQCTPGLTSDVPATYEDLLDRTNGLIATKEDGYDTDSCIVSGKTATISTNLQYPSANRMFTVVVTNTGSIDMKLDAESMGRLEENFINDSLIDSNEVYNQITGYYVNGEDATSTIETSVIAPGEKAIFTLVTFWEQSDTEHNGVSQKDTFTYTLPYIQAN